MSTEKAEPKQTSNTTIALAGGLFSGLAAIQIVPKLSASMHDRLETSQSMTILVIAIGFVLGAIATFLIVRKVR